MRALFALLLLPTLAFAQTAEETKATVAFIEGLRDKETGAYKVTADGKPSLRACNGAVKSLKALGEKVTQIEKIQKFILSCYDAKTGAFAEPGGKPDVTITSVGIIAACEVGISQKDFPKSMDYVLENAKAFEEVRIGAAAVEAWGAKGLKLDGIKEAFVLDYHPETFTDLRDGASRESAAVLVTSLRFGLDVSKFEPDALRLKPGQCDDGGWRKKGEKTSDIESTYRVMRAFKMLDATPKDVPQLRKFISSHRNKDGGSATKPGEPSTMSGTYYAVIISKWLDDMEKMK